MKSAFFLAILFVAALANECSYPTQDGFSDYFFENEWLNTTDSSNNIWFFQDGCFGYSETSPCPTSSPVCVILSGTTEAVSAAIQTPQDSYSYIANGLEFVFTSETPCYSESVGEKSTMKTTLDFNCDPEINSVSFTVSFDGCFTVITANSSWYCPSGEVTLDNSQDAPYYYSSESGEANVGGFAFFSLGIMILFTLGCLISVCLCCCCMVRRRRQKKIQTAMRQFSNVAFQPIPYSNPIRQPTQATNSQHAQVPIPAYNPYLGQPQQFVYYYPAQVPTQVNAPIPLQQFGDSNRGQDDSDEKFAKELQAQFDREEQV